MGDMVLSRRVSAFLIAFGVWSWVIWPTFLKNIWVDPRSFHHGPTGFFLVHALLTAVSLVLGTVIALIGIRGWRGRPSRPQARPPARQAGAPH